MGHLDPPDLVLSGHLLNLWPQAGVSELGSLARTSPQDKYLGTQRQGLVCLLRGWGWQAGGIRQSQRAAGGPDMQFLFQEPPMGVTAWRLGGRCLQVLGWGTGVGEEGGSALDGQGRGQIPCAGRGWDLLRPLPHTLMTDRTSV